MSNRERQKFSSGAAFDTIMSIMFLIVGTVAAGIGHWTSACFFLLVALWFK